MKMSSARVIDGRSVFSSIPGSQSARWSTAQQIVMATSAKIPWCLALVCSFSQAVAAVKIANRTNDSKPIPIVVTTWANQGFVSATDKGEKFGIRIRFYNVTANLQRIAGLR